MDLQEGLKRNLTQAIGKEINVRIADDDRGGCLVCDRVDTGDDDDGEGRLLKFSFFIYCSKCSKTFPN